ncbi:Zn(2)-C6 fungal-type DNA-binding domain protein [Ilyonectria robusta]
MLIASPLPSTPSKAAYVLMSSSSSSSSSATDSPLACDATTRTNRANTSAADGNPKNELRGKIGRLKKSNDGRGDLLESIASLHGINNRLQPALHGSVDSNGAQDDYSPRGEDDLSSRLGSSSKGTDTWTRTGWTRAHIRHLFDSVLTWDYLPFSLLCKDQFLQDYQNGSSQFCSSALVHAILSLASRLINENDDDFSLLPSGCFGSKLFLNETETLLQANEPLDSLPDIQALGMLAFYQTRCGQEAKAHELAEACIDRISKIRQQSSSAGKDEPQYSRACAVTYCGAVSLVRILQLTTGLAFNAPTYALQDAALILDNPVLSSTGHGQADASTESSLAIITAKVFQLAEVTYNLVASARLVPETAMDDVVAVYAKCLDWYEGFFALVSREGSRTPFKLFVQ